MNIRNTPSNISSPIPVTALFLDMGLGKTVTTLTAIRDLMYDTFEVQRVLVVAPLRVAERHLAG